MTSSTIAYNKMVQSALRGVVRDILRRVESDGLIGSQHFYIAFRTRAPGVKIPKVLLDRYPEEMTIVIQHRFWGLKIHEESFEIGLSFHQKPEHLEIPFEAILGFVDPSDHFALQFEDFAGNEEVSASPAATISAQLGNDSGDDRADDDPVVASDQDVSQSDEKPTPLPVVRPEAGLPVPETKKVTTTKTFVGRKSGEPVDSPEPDNDTNPEGGNVVQLDRFRKKS
ncbi:MAG: ClpXP protease specificity-enhancing factor SspB [Pseudomonadota bacterium]